MPKIRIPAKVVDYFRGQARGIDELEEFMEFPNQVLPVFIVNPSTVPAEVSDPLTDVMGMFEQQADATLVQANPVSGTEYPVLAATENVRLIHVAIKCTWTVQPTPLQLHITIDGQTLIAYFDNPVSNQWYTIEYRRADDPGFHLNTTTIPRAFLLEGRSIAVTAEITGGTVSQLSARVKYATM